MATPAIPDAGVTSPAAQAQLNVLAAEDTAKGQVPVHTFDPNAPPEAKAAQAAQGEEKLKRHKYLGESGVGERRLERTPRPYLTRRQRYRLTPEMQTCCQP